MEVRGVLERWEVRGRESRESEVARELWGRCIPGESV